MNSYASSLFALGLVLLGGAAAAEEAAPLVTENPAIVGVPGDSGPPLAPPVIELPSVPPPPAVFASLRDDLSPPALAGVENGAAYLRDQDDSLRIYPAARLTLDGHASPGAPSLLGGTTEGNGLGATFLVRRIGFDFSGVIHSRLAFTAGIELGGSRIGTTEYVGPGTSRIGMPSAHDGRVRPADAHVSYLFRRWLNFTAGQQLLPFSMSNRTPDAVVEVPERPLAIRAFAVPWHRDIGLTVWGEAAPKEYLHYEVGVFSGDGYEHAFADALPEFAGRIHSRPLAALGSAFILSKAQIGLSARIGSRDPTRVTYDHPTVATGQGWVLWQPGYIDSLGRATHVLPSGLQRAIGGELRLPLQLPGGRVLDLQSELYYVENDTRESVTGFLSTNTERFGRTQGVGWYAQLSFWCCGDAHANGDVGVVVPPRVALQHPAATATSHARSEELTPVSRVPRGLELLLLASGIDANYDGAGREGSTRDAKTPRSNIKVFQLGGGAQYWFGKNFRSGVFYSGYVAPKSASASNLVVLPGNVPDENGVTSGATVLHELTFRLAAGF